MEANKRRFRYVRLNKNNIKDTTILTTYGEKNKDLFLSLSFSSITVDTKKQAEEVRSSIVDKNITFEEAAKAYSTDSGKEVGGDRGTLFSYQIEEQEGREALNAIKNINTVNTISPPIENLKGNYTIYTITKLPITPDFSTEKIQNAIKNYMLANTPDIIQDNKIKEAETFINAAKKIGFNAAANKYDLETGKTNMFPLNIQNTSALTKIKKVEGADIGSLASESDILENIFFTLNKNQYSTPFLIGTYIYVFEVLDISKDNAVAPDITAFGKETRESMLKDIIITKGKFKDNFESAYTKINSPSSSQNPQTN